ncbi:hypothetical protein VKT23_006233 [Stygiomarasmius scandens]|uniref:DUF6593 domain-containing protein n=1 Tax=Marasmiellus scandens TaxID=2682957 RepID=A0ABR1JP94_9AGAR
MKELVFSSAQDMLLSGDLLNTDIIDSKSSQPVYNLHAPEKSGLKGLNKMDSFTVCVDKFDVNGGNRELVAMVEKHTLHSDVIKMYSMGTDREIKPLDWVEKKNKLEFTNPWDGEKYQWHCEGTNFRLVKNADSSSEVAMFKQGKRVPPEERLATGQDKPEQRWTTPTLIVNAEESLDLIISSFVYYAKIKIDSMGGFASVQSAGVYSAGIGNLVSAVTGPAAVS